MLALTLRIVQWTVMLVFSGMVLRNIIDLTNIGKILTCTLRTRTTSDVTGGARRQVTGTEMRQ